MFCSNTEMYPWKDDKVCSGKYHVKILIESMNTLLMLKRYCQDVTGGPVMGLCFPMLGVQVPSLVRVLGSHLPCGQWTKT